MAGVSVAVKQAMPDHVVYRSPVGKITNRNVPLACFLLAFVLWAIGKKAKTGGPWLAQILGEK